MDIDEGIDDTEMVGQYGALVQEQLALIGENPSREGLLRTPERVAKAMQFLTRGYHQRVEDVVSEGIFAEEHRNMVMVRDIELYSLCEHHLLPFFGRAHVAYIPDGRIVGLSKLPRIVDVFARRLAREISRNREHRALAVRLRRQLAYWCRKGGTPPEQAEWFMTIIRCSGVPIITDTPPSCREPEGEVSR